MNYRAALAFSALLALAGCGQEETITTHEALRTEPRTPPLDVEATRASLDHMLVAIVPQGRQAWFFKVVVPGKDADAVRQPFHDFVATIGADSDGEKPTWKLPEDWTETPGDGEMRAATIEIPHSGGKAELAVSALPRGEKPWPIYLRENVNRWMKQLQQPGLPQETIAKISRTVSLKPGEATVLELVGAMAATPGAMPPGHPPVAGAGEQRPAVAEAPAATPSAEAAKPSQAGFDYTAPEGWTPGRLNSMRRAAFNVVDGDKTAEMTVMPFPANPAMTDPVAQAKRWAGEVGLADSTDEDLKKTQSDVTIDGVEGQQFVLLGPGKGAGPLGTLAAMVRRGDQVWFFKMFGDQALVESQREAFDAFLKSVDFPDGD